MGIGLLDELQSDNEFLAVQASLRPAREMGRIQIMAIPFLNTSSREYNSMKETENSVKKAMDKLLKGEVSDELFESVRRSLLQEYDRSMEYQYTK